MVSPFKVLRYRLQAAFPALAFFGGFLWDSITLRGSLGVFDFLMLFGYLLVSALLLVLLGRRENPAGHTFDSDPNPEQENPSRVSQIWLWMKTRGPLFLLQFCYGSIFSALVIFYFLSSSYLPGFLVVLGLVILLCLNEFLESQYHRFTLTWTLFGLCAILFLNFALPHLFHSIHSIWFYLSTTLGVLFVNVLKRFSPIAQGALWPTYAMAGGLVFLYLINAIPPVPLVKKEMLICRDLEKKELQYTAKIEKPKPLFFWRRSESHVHQMPGEKIYCFTSIFLPQGISCTLYHRWMFDDPKTNRWVEVSRISFPIRGGRMDGFRGFTYKRSLAPGDWKVRVETESGRVLGAIPFTVESEIETNLEYKVIDLN
jgi:hypothetical protein